MVNKALIDSKLKSQVDTFRKAGDKNPLISCLQNAPAYGGRSVCVYVNKKLIFNICAGVDLIIYN